MEQLAGLIGGGTLLLIIVGPPVAIFIYLYLVDLFREAYTDAD